MKDHQLNQIMIGGNDKNVDNFQPTDQLRFLFKNASEGLVKSEDWETWKENVNKELVKSRQME